MRFVTSLFKFLLALAAIGTGMLVLVYFDVIPLKKIPLPKPVEEAISRLTNPNSQAADIRDIRLWTSRTGSTVEASIADFTESSVTLKKTDGQLIEVSRNDFSKEDLEYLDLVLGSNAAPDPAEQQKLPRIRVSSSLNAWEKINLTTSLSASKISIDNLSDYPSGELEVIWTWAHPQESQLSLGSTAEKAMPRFRKSAKIKVSLDPLESVTFVTPPVAFAKSKSFYHSIVVQVLIDGKLIAFDSGHPRLDEWARREDLERLIKPVKVIKKMELTNSLGNARN